MFKQTELERGAQRYARKFQVKHDRAWGWHIGLFFCVEPEWEETGKRDIYLFFCFSTHDFSIGMLTEPVKEKGEEDA